MNDYGKFLLLAASITATAWCSKKIYDRHFKGKTKEEIAQMLDEAFDKIFAFARILHTSAAIIEQVAYNLKNGYTSLSDENATQEKIHTLYTLIDDINTLTNNAPELQEPLEIISDAIHCTEERIALGA